MPTFKEQQQALIKHQHLLAIWEYVYEHLDDNYISKDGREVEKGLRAPGCLVDLVPEDVIDEVLMSISAGPIEELKKRVDNIQNQELVIMEKDDTDAQE